MSSLSRIFKNSLFLALSRGLTLLASLGIYALIGRLLGADGLGQFSFILAYAGMFIFLSSLGLHLYVVREIARRRDQVELYLGNALALILLFSPIACGVMVLVAFAFLSLEPMVQVGIAIAGLYLVLGTLLVLFRAAFHSFERMELDTASTLAENVAIISLCAVVLLSGGGVIGLIVAYAVARLLALVITILLYIRSIGPLPLPTLHPSRSRAILIGALPFALNILTTTVYVQIDLLLLNLWQGDAASGYYKAATSLVIPLSIVATSVNRALFPDMARSFFSSLPRLTRTVESSIRYLFMLGWPMALGLALLAPQVIHLVYGSEFAPSVLCLRILAFIVPMRYINNTMGATLTATDRQGWRATMILLSALLNLLLNLFMIPAWSYVGASISTLLTEIFITIALYVTMRRHLSAVRLPGLIWRSLIGGLVMAAAIYWLQDASLLLVIPVGVLIYALALIGLKALPHEDMVRVKKALPGLVQRPVA